jgi:hypothetical protein
LKILSAVTRLYREQDTRTEAHVIMANIADEVCREMIGFIERIGHSYINGASAVASTDCREDSSANQFEPSTSRRSQGLWFYEIFVFPLVKRRERLGQSRFFRRGGTRVHSTVQKAPYLESEEPLVPHSSVRS